MTLDPAPSPITVRIKDACRMTGIGRSKLYLLIAEGKDRDDQDRQHDASPCRIDRSVAERRQARLDEASSVTP